MVTEPPTDGQTMPLQEFETLYIGGAKPADVRRSLETRSWDQDLGQDLAESTRLRRKLNDHDGSIVFGWGRDQWNKHEVER